jgi:tRNA modification GTPase
LTEPFRVVLTGRPNVGKSSLINALVGFQRSIVFDQPGTTRDVVTAETAWDGWPVLLADTAGLRANAEGLEAHGIDLAHKQIEQADLVLIVLDASSTSEVPPVQDDVGLLPFGSHPDQRSRTITITNKIDLVLNDRASEISRVQADFFVSAVTGEGLEHLITELGRQLVPNEPPVNVPIPVSQLLVNWLGELQGLVLSGADITEIDKVLRSIT